MDERKTLTLTALASALALIGNVQAQEAAEPQTVVVTGLRASLESALNAKRTENSIVDVVKAEDIGKFPDTNLAESLQRVPGVAIDRDAGEGRSITVRGLGQDFTRVRINGIEALATTGGSDNSGGNNRGRGFDFNVFASELFSSLTVRKSSAAEVEEGSLGATVDLQTMRPFDLAKRGFNATAMIKGRYNDLSKKTDPRGAFMISDTFNNNTMGYLVSVAYGRRKLYEDGFSTGRWDNGPSVGGWCAPMGVGTSTSPNCSTSAPGFPAATRLPGTPENIAAYNAASNVANYHPRLPRYGRMVHEQDRLGITASFEWKPQRGTRISFDMLYADLDATREENYLEAFSFSRNLSSGGKPQTSVVNAQYDALGRLQYGVYNGVDIRSESRYDEMQTKFTQPTLTISHQITPDWRINAAIGRAKSTFDNPIQTTVTLDAPNVNGYTIDFRQNDRLPVITYPFDVTKAGVLNIYGVPAGATAAANSLPSEIRVRPQGTTNINDVASADLSWRASDTWTFKTGLNLKRYKFNTWEFRRANTAETVYGLPAGTDVSGLTKLLSGFGTGQDMPAGNATAWVVPDVRAITALYDAYCNCLKTGAANGPGDYTLTSLTNSSARGNNRAIEEKDKGFYLQGDFDMEAFGVPLRGNVGGRYVKTELEALGYLASGGGTPVTAENDYHDFLPALNVTANVTNDFLIRFAAAKVMSRPQLGNLSPGGSLSTVGALGVSTGNPLLAPFRAKTFDASFEYYFPNKAFFGVGLFQKNISNYVQAVRQAMPYNQTGLPLSLLPANFTGTEMFDVTSFMNTPGGKLRGVELNYQQPFTFLPAWGRNFGLIANYTRVSSKIDYIISANVANSGTVRDDLVNLSPRSWNTTLYYDDGKFSARLTGAYRSGYLQVVPAQNNNDVQGKNETTNVDLSLSYKINDKLEVTFEGVNLTNEASDQFVGRARNSVMTHNVTGREYLLGMRYKF
ncbi:TonB-dependent receptor [Pseudoduganella flava]|uniref:TonB-dependent receptor n=1 Tax=Pseudoduganella flava TaxID=871742 RepID=A0A562Q131_9BURK|nr:TonB-dependent receptor [Pseudoduganella flava]QGZ38086.1 TonB-dependent receptor [Pseudoduganella flava]TWI50401.1 TonB-dependent receptor [Pseudoduganella flava]